MKNTPKPLIAGRITEIGRQFSDATILMHEAIAKKLGLTGTDHKYLGILLQRGTMSAGELSQITGLSTGAVTGLIDRFENKKLVKRIHDKNDRRKVIIEPVAESIMNLTGPVFSNLQEKMTSFLLTFSDQELEVIEKYCMSCIEILTSVTEGVLSNDEKL